MTESQFTLKEWEDIVAKAITNNEERKRECTRWTAAGITGAVALLGILIDRLASSDLGGLPFLSLLLILLFVYVVLRAGWEILERRIVSAIAVIAAARPQPETPGEVLKTMIAAAEINPRRFLSSALFKSVVVTAVVLLTTLLFSMVAGPLIVVFVWRVAALFLFVPVFLLFRAVGRLLLKERKRIETETPRDFTPEQQRQRLRNAVVYTAILIVYYSVQVWFIWQAMALVVSPTYGFVQVTGLVLGIGALATWVHGITWPMVEKYSVFMRQFQDIHMTIVMGGVTAAEVAARVKSLAQMMEGSQSPAD